MTAALPEHAKGKPIEIWFQDEARIGQKGSLTRLWARRGSRPQAPRDRRYEWAYLFGAVCPEAPAVNQDTGSKSSSQRCGGFQMPIRGHDDSAAQGRLIQVGIDIPGL